MSAPASPTCSCLPSHPTPHLYSPPPTTSDQLGLNTTDTLTLAEGGPRAQRARQAMLRNELLAGLTQLPKPTMEYAIEAPELPEEEEGVAGMLLGGGGIPHPCRPYTHTHTSLSHNDT